MDSKTVWIVAALLAAGLVAYTTLPLLACKVADLC